MSTENLLDRLGALAPQQVRQELLELVLRTARPMTEAPLRAEQRFADLGLGSLGAVELHRTLSATTGLDLPLAMAFDHPTPQALAGFLAERLLGSPNEPDEPEATFAAPALSDDPVVLVGMGCRFPGDVRSPEDLWRLVLAETDAIGEFPSDRGWAPSFSEDPDEPGTSYVRSGGFLRDAGGFDAAFFGVSPREAEAMDPQQRLLLEVSWEAVERARIDPRSLAGTRTGVFVGLEDHEYGPRLVDARDGAESHLITGNAASVGSGRIAYVLGLNGPALTVDTACSGSLVALHLAAQSLARGECDLALAGGAAVMATTGGFLAFSRQRGLAADGRCKAFGEDADGTGWGEGAGIVVLERLSDARRHGRTVLAVLKGSAVNSDGATNGLTAPSGRAQQQVIRQALAGAGVPAAGVDVVEAHGTGTTLGDLIEAQALLATYGQNRTEPVHLGSLKSNIGHTQAAAGVAGVIKMVMAMRAGVMPRTLHADQPSTRVDWDCGAVSLLQSARPWNAVPSRPRRAGVSAFGFSGTNAHLILEEAPPAAVVPPERDDFAVLFTESSAGTLTAALLERFGALGETHRAATAELGVHGAVVYSFADQIALFRLLEAHDRRPEKLLGQRTGLVAAAHAAGVLSLADAAALVAVHEQLKADVAARLVTADEAAGELRWAASVLSYAPAQVPVWAYGRALSDAELGSADFWVSHLLAEDDLDLGPAASGWGGEALALSLDGQPRDVVRLLGAAGVRGLTVDWDRFAWPLLLSGRTATAAREAAARLADARSAESPSAADLAWSLARTRSTFEHRIAVLGDEVTDLRAAAAGQPSPHVIESVAGVQSRPVFVFPGQGGQWPGMATELLRTSPVFGRSMAECARSLEPFVDWSLWDVLDDEQALERVDVIQPVLWAVMVSLAALWRSCGVEPAAVVGHSQGEIAALCVAGGLSLDDGARVVARRSQAIARSLGAGGAMGAVALPAGQVAEALEEGVSIAAVNGPASVVVSGELVAVTRLVQRFKDGGARARVIPVDYASHSPAVDALREELLQELAPLAPRTSSVPVFSSVTGAPIDTASADAGYWFRNLRQSVLFEDATRYLAAQGHTLFLEIGPHPVLTEAIQETLDDSENIDAGLVLATLRRGDGSTSRFVAALAEAFVNGVQVDWESVFAGSPARPVDLPTYPFEHRHFWIDDRPAGSARTAPVPVPVLAAEPFDAAEPADLRELVGQHVAAVLGHRSADEIDTAKAFRDLGFDSLAAVQLRNRLGAATGLDLPTTLIFDHPTVQALAGHLAALLGQGPDRSVRAVTGAPAGADDDPIVVVGMACRLPGGVQRPEQLWDLLLAGGDGITAFPTDRGWDPEGVLGSSTDQGGFLPEAGDFDAAFFGISPREALAMDPQQRLVLETSWEALEDAGIDPTSLAGMPVGVFVGAIASGYGEVVTRSAPDLAGQLVTGAAQSVLSGRVSYSLGLQGPAVTVDTACSSSLVAMHWAAQSLRSGECTSALVGGVSVMATTEPFAGFSQQGGLAPDGRCKAFSDAADGTSWSEGVGMIVLQRLSEARRDGRPVLAVLRSSAVNQDGASNGLTAPNGPAQQQVIRQALAGAGLRGADVDAVEAHGTGTVLGDPIEAQALIATYGQDRSEPLYLGSLKSNIGHTQATAGVAGVIKMILSMRHGVLPRTLHVERPSTQMDWADGTVQLLTEATAWPTSSQRPRRAGVSSFGVSGTNAHVILEAPEPEDVPAPVPLEAPVAWVLSARTPQALREQARRLAGSAPDATAADVAWSLVNTRTAFAERAVVIGSDPVDLRSSLQAFAAGEAASPIVRGRARGGSVGVLFSGQGSQRLGMGAGLRERSAVFAQALDEVVAELDQHLDGSLSEVMRGSDADLLQRTGWAQPALFAIEVALFQLLRSWGVRPAFLAGHSVGEVAAAHVSGVLSLPDAARLVAARGRLMQALPAGGAMTALEASEEEVAEFLGEDVSLAAVNAPGSVVISGVEAAVQRVGEHFAGLGRRTTRLKVSHAFHSALMEPMLADFQAVLETLDWKLPSIPVVSTLTGALADPAEFAAPEYWLRQARSAVRFADAVAALESLGARTLIELGPNGSLAAMAQQTASADVLAVPMLRGADHPEYRSALTAAGTLWVHGAPVQWDELVKGGRRIALPTYAFQHERYWIEDAPVAADVSAAGMAGIEHPVLGARLDLPAHAGVVFSGRVSMRTLPWLSGYELHEQIVLPAGLVTDLVIRAGDEVGCGRIDELVMEAPAVVPPTGSLQLQVLLVPERDRWLVEVHTRPEGAQQWRSCATATLSLGGETSDGLRQWPPAGAQMLDLTAGAGSAFDVAVQEPVTGAGALACVSRAWRRGRQVWAEAELPEVGSELGLHPALLDVALQVAGLADTAESGAALIEVVPAALTDVELYATGAQRIRIQVELGDDGLGVTVADAGGEPVLTAGCLQTVPVDELVLGDASDDTVALGLDWLPAAAQNVAGDWVEVGGETGFANVAALLASIEAGRAVPDGVVLLPSGVTTDQPDDGAPERALRVTAWTLDQLQTWLTDPRLAAGSLTVITRGAVSVGVDEAIADPAGAAVWGLVRTAATENPGRICLVDLEPGAAVRVLAGAGQWAVRGETVYAPRLVRRAVPGTEATEIKGRVLVTGGTGGLGQRVARHLVTAYGVSDLLLMSRRGDQAAGTAALIEELAALGARATVVACDVADRQALARVLAEHPVTGVVHTAGLVEDGTLTSLSAGHLGRVFAPKVSGTWNLHELAGDLDLFVVFSSMAGMLGDAGQANYAAANHFADAVVELRRAQGLPGVSMAWGAWSAEAGLTAALSEADLRRLNTSGLPTLRPEQGLSLFDRALSFVHGQSGPSAVLGLTRLDLAGLRARPQLPPVLTALAGRTARRSAGSQELTGFAQRWATVPPTQRASFLHDLVRDHVAAVLGHRPGTTVDPAQPFRELGFDSLTAVELRNQLAAVTGIALPATLVFDHPTANALVEHLTEMLQGSAVVPEGVAGAAAGVADDPIAIIGMACRYPGEVTTPEELWDLVLQGRDAISGFPGDRDWDLSTLEGGASVTSSGGFLTGAGDFDASFFGISPREAIATDPQQRLLLETSWEALEYAGIAPDSLQGQPVGVFAGAFESGYAQLAASAGDDLAGHLMTGGSQSVVSGRVSYVLGLRGPALTVDTACSSSLVALHLAAQALRSGECSMALAGGVTVMATAETFVGFTQQGGLSADGRCKAYADGADGTGWAEGAGMLVLQRLSDAQREGRRVLAVLRSSAVNQDGASNGLTAPNGPAQQRVIRSALHSAGLAPADIQAVEGHGTGTVLGDPIEAQALLATYGQDRPGPLYLGSLKSNIGHTQAAAGVGGVIKMVMALRHGVLPRTLHVGRPSTKVDWAAGDIQLLTEQTPWPATDGPRRAGISAFGVSGTNAHVIIEAVQAAPVALAETDVEGSDGPLGHLGPVGVNGPLVPWVLSARSAKALQGQARRLLTRLGENAGTVDAVDVGRSLIHARSATFEHRAVVTGRAGLQALAQGEPAPELTTARARPLGAPVFVFPGQGAQWAGMGRELLRSSTVFASALADCQRALDPYVDWLLTDVLADAQALERVDVVQPASWALMVSLSALWQAHGVQPAAVVGHSQGEIAALCVAGALSLEDGARIVSMRSRIIAEELAGRGGMIAVGLGAEAVADLIRPWGEDLSLAAVNSPSSVVLAGTPAAVQEVAARCESDGVRARILPVDYASHSAQVDAIAERLLSDLHGIAPRPGEIPVYSTVTGSLFDPAQADPAYWVRNLRHTVKLAPVVQDLAEAGKNAFVEISAHPVLVGAIQETVADAVAVGTLRREDGGPSRLLTSLAELFVAGGPVDWRTLFAQPGRFVQLPTYPFDRQRYWPPAGTHSADVRGAGLAPAGHPLLGAALELPEDGAVVLTGRLSARSHPWLEGRTTLPAAALLELAVRAGDEVGAEAVRRFTLETALLLPEQAAVQLRVTVKPSGDEWTVGVYARPDVDGEWTRHATGVLGSSVEATFDADEPGIAIAVSDVPGFGLHPALLDAALQSAAQTFEGADLVVGEFHDVTLHASGACEGSAALQALAPGSYRLRITDPVGLPVLSIGSLTLVPAAEPAARTTDVTVLVPDWERVKVDPASSTGWVVVGEGGTQPDLGALIDLVDTGAAVPGAVVLAVPRTPDVPDSPAGVAVSAVVSPLDPTGPIEAAHSSAIWTLAQAQRWLGDARFAHTRLIVVTRSAVTTSPDEVVDLAASTVWGLIRTAQTENPDRIVLADLPLNAGLDLGLLAGVAASAESQVALRGANAGTVLAARLVRHPAPASPGSASPDLSDGTVLLTGASGGLGRLFARHLVHHHGVRNLLLVSRRGPAAEGMSALTGELTDAGAHVTVEACDVSDRDAVVNLLRKVPDTRPLIGIVHTAGVLDDGVITSLTPERVRNVLRAKVDAAWHLHELTQHLDLRLFALFSSLAGQLGGPGQGNYAAGNVYLDTLAQWREAQGLAATSLAWGAWTPETGLTGTLNEVDLKRMAKAGMPLLTLDQGLELFDRALADEAPVLGLTRLDIPGLRASGDVPPVLRTLTGGSARRSASRSAPDDFAQRWAAMEPRRRGQTLRDLLRRHLAAVLGHSSSEDIDDAQAFREMGLDSLTAVELRNQLGAATGLALPATLVFDFPTVSALSAHLAVLLGGPENTPARPEVPVPTPVDDPIVIVGMSCRFPGGVSGPDELWNLLAEGRDAIGAFPTDRGWDLEDLIGSGASVTARGGFLEDVGGFDAAFFGISPREALAMDPQQRILLETAWEAVEDAGIDPTGLAGEPVGVFVGAFPSGWTELATRADRDLAGHLITGGSQSVLSGRVSYVMGLQGPAVTVDTACSSSLVALHWAAQALRTGECSMALAGGVTVIATPDTFIGFSQQGGLAPDGRCKAFADSADGTGWSEGAGMLVLQRLSDARRDKRPVLAVLRSSAVNQDGASNGLTAPNGPAQQRVIRQALAAAGLSGSDVDVVEGHGTGTVLGDPIEAQALLATYGQDRDEPLYLGSLKSNLGHTQAAAGVAGVVKMVLAMRHGTVPASLHVQAPSAKVDWSSGAVQVLTRNTPWPSSGRPRRAGVSSFGVSGTNAHVILEQPEPEDVPAPVTPEGPLPWVVSGKTEDGVRAQAGRLAGYVAENPAGPLDIGWSLANQRARFGHRAVVVGADRDELLEGLRALAAGSPSAAVTLGQSRGASDVAVVFSGQGSQWPGMGRELYEAAPAFAQAFDEVTRALDEHLERPLREVMWPDAGPAEPEAGQLQQTGWAQPALFALEVALFRLLQAYGVCPAHLAGHSVGEIAAAHVSGALTLPDAARLVAARGRLMQALPAGGAMVAIEAAEDEVSGLLGEAVTVAAVNSPTFLVVAGAEDDVLALAETFAAMGRRTKRLKVSHAFHSPLMEPMLAEFEQVLKTLRWGTPDTPIVSTLTGGPVTPEDFSTPEYWVRQAREGVRWADAVRALESLGVRTLIEAGPNGSLAAAAQESLSPAVRAVPVLRGADNAGLPSVMNGLAAAFVNGAAVDWNAFLAGGRGTTLPTYAFQRERYWVEVPVEKTDESAVLEAWRYRESWTLLPESGQAQVADGPADWVVVAPVSLLDDPEVSLIAAALSARTVGFDGSAFTGQLGASERVLSLLSWDESTPGFVPAGVVPTLALLQRLERESVVWAATRGAVSTGAGDPVLNPRQAGISGLGRVAALERPDQWGGVVDLPSQIDSAAARRLAGLLRRAGTDNREDQLALRPHGVFGRRLMPAPAPGGLTQWKARGTVLVTGGTGGLGALVARWAATAGAEHLVLLSRRGEQAPGADRLAEDLRNLGASVTFAAADAADEGALSDVLEQIPSHIPLRAVVHAAGVSHGVVEIDDTTPEQVEAEVRAKAGGAALLDELTRGLDLDAFVLFSSGASAWGSGGQAAYASANAYLDALAARRRAEGLPGLAIAWGNWAEAGMAVDNPEQGEYLRRLGVLPMPPRLALIALGQALQAGESGLTVTNMDWAKFAPAFTVSRPSALLSELPQVQEVLAGPIGGQDDAFAKQWRETRPEERQKFLRALVREHVAAALGHRSGSRIEAGQAFKELGFDSLTAVELRNQLGAATGLNLPATMVFDHPSIAELAEFLAAELTWEPAGAEPERPAAAVPVTDEDDEALLTADVDDLIRLALGEDE
ncbi:hypothetical protein Kisp01_33600 [Kineosporia sp. NBRC 101677]|nr:type I polyketide synthase [Kineosporia sp. NBRC 101677]GLY16345.1 hypothetical protein Kisp01_33600 [Kineosporia sp. NBRC 101677]